MNKEEKTTAFDYFKVSKKARLVLDGNEYKLFTAIAERCNVNDNWWSITNENLQKESGLKHNSFLRCKKSLEEKKFIINLNKNVREEETYKTKTSKLSINVEEVLKYEIKDTTTEYNFNKKKSTNVELGTTAVPKSKEEELGTELEPKLGTTAVPKLGTESVPLNRITKEEKENNMNNNYSTTGSETLNEENKGSEPTKQEHSSFYNKLKSKLDSMYSSRQEQDFRRLQKAYIAYYNEVYKSLNSVEHDSIQNNYMSILKAKAKFYHCDVDDLYVSTREDDESLSDLFGCGGTTNFSSPKQQATQPKEEPKVLTEEQQALMYVGSLIGYDMSSKA